MPRQPIVLALAGIALLLCVAPARAQSLNDSLETVRQALTAQGQLVETETVRDSSNGSTWVERWTILYENVTANLSACSLTFHAEFSINGKSTFSGDRTYPIGQVSGLEMLTMDANMNRNDAKGGHPTWTVQANPPGYDVLIVFKAGNTGGFYTRTQSAAASVAEALDRSARLCGASPTRVNF